MLRKISSGKSAYIRTSVPLLVLRRIFVSCIANVEERHPDKKRVHNVQLETKYLDECCRVEKQLKGNSMK